MAYRTFKKRFNSRRFGRGFSNRRRSRGGKRSIMYVYLPKAPRRGRRRF